MYCNQCGEEVPEDSKFCPFCGASTVKRKRKDQNPEPKKSEGLHDNFMDDEVKKNLRDIGKNPKAIGKNPKFMGKESMNHSSTTSELKRKIVLLIISTLIVSPFLLLWVHAQNKEKETLNQAVQQIESKQYDDAAVTLVTMDSKEGKDLYNLAEAFKAFGKKDYDLADSYLKDVSIETMEHRYPDLKDNIDAMKTKLDDTSEARKKASLEKYEADQKQKKAEAQQRAQEYQNTLHIGDPDNKIVDVMGRPEAKNTTQVDGHQSVQWVYRNSYIYTDDGVITGFQKFE